MPSTCLRLLRVSSHAIFLKANAVLLRVYGTQSTMACMVAYLGFTQTTQVRLPLGRRLFGRRCGRPFIELLRSLVYGPDALPAAQPTASKH